MVAPLLLSLALAASPAAGRRIDTCDRVRFRIPPGFDHLAATEGGVRRHSARSREAVVSVGAIDVPEGVDCESEQVRERGARTVRLRGGPEACEFAGSAEGVALVALLFPVSEGRAAVVTAVGKNEVAARAAARLVAETVEPSAGPRPDPRLVGCFENSFSSGGTTGFGMRSTVRCFEEDGRLTERTSLHVSSHPPLAAAGVSAYGDWDPEESSWCLDGDVLTQRRGDAVERGQIEIGQRGFIQGRAVWIRLGD